MVWKHFVRSTITQYWQEKHGAETGTKSILNMWIISENNNIGMLKACQSKIYLVEATTTRMRMLAGRYQLQTTRAKYNQYAVDPTCPLCLKEPETITHFLMECVVLEQTRRPKVSGILAQLEVEAWRYQRQHMNGAWPS